MVDEPREPEERLRPWVHLAVPELPLLLHHCVRLEARPPGDLEVLFLRLAGEADYDLRVTEDVLDLPRLLLRREVHRLIRAPVQIYHGAVVPPPVATEGRHHDRLGVDEALPKALDSLHPESN